MKVRRAAASSTLDGRFIALGVLKNISVRRRERTSVGCMYKPPLQVKQGRVIDRTDFMDDLYLGLFEVMTDHKMHY